jgi:hypothetical protein
MKLVYSISKFIGALVVITSAVYGSITFIFKKGIDSERKQNRTYILEEKVDRLILADSTKSLMMMKFKESLEDNTRETRDNTKATKAAVKSLANHYKLSNKIDELYQLLQEQKDEKKNYQRELILSEGTDQ